VSLIFSSLFWPRFAHSEHSHRAAVG
jgi:hypothetical protein